MNMLKSLDKVIIGYFVFIFEDVVNKQTQIPSSGLYKAVVD